MTQTGGAADTRAVIRCPGCKLVQFETHSGLCRRCRAVLVVPEVEEIPVEGTVGELRRPADGRLKDSELSVPVFSPALLVAMRARRHLSQTGLAAILNLPRTYISKLEQGGCVPTVVNLFKLANALKCHFEELLSGPDGKRRTQTELLLSDPYIAEIAQYSVHLTEEQRNLLITQARLLSLGIAA